MTWLNDVHQAVKSNKGELVLKGATAELDDETLQAEIFETMTNLNYLSITSSFVTRLSTTLSSAKNLLKLILTYNELTEIPDVFEGLDRLQFIDVSYNQLQSLPQSIGELPNLESLIFNNNSVSQLPNLSKLANLHVIIGSHNSLESIPNSLFDLSQKLLVVDLSDNEIQEIDERISNLAHLKELRLTQNQVKRVPFGLSELPKLSILDLSTNPISDPRLKKLVNDPRMKISAVQAYIAKTVKKVACKPESDVKTDDVTERVKKLSLSQKGKIVVITGCPDYTVTRHKSVLDVRPYLVCCVLEGVSLAGDNFKKFLAAQTKLHASELGGNRETCAVGTHKMGNFTLPLTYLALNKDDLHIKALNKKSVVSATELLNSMFRDAELARKAKKRSHIDPLYRYLHLVKIQEEMACLMDAENTVISLPPITNSDSTKLTLETTSVWVEVSSSKSLSACKQAMDWLIMETLQFMPELAVKQVRVVDTDNLISVYPDENDLPELTQYRSRYDQSEC